MVVSSFDLLFWFTGMLIIIIIIIILNFPSWYLFQNCSIRFGIYYFLNCLSYYVQFIASVFKYVIVVVNFASSFFFFFFICFNCVCHILSINYYIFNYFSNLIVFLLFTSNKPAMFCVFKGIYILTCYCRFIISALAIKTLFYYSRRTVELN